MKEYNVFVSHSWQHLEDLKDLRKNLEARGYFKVVFHEITPEHPINSDNSAYVRSCLSTEIGKSDVLLALAGVYASYSDWMQWEMDTAKRKGLKIVGVVPWGQQNVSTAVSSRADEVVRWNTDSIVDAIRRNSK